MSSSSLNPDPKQRAGRRWPPIAFEIVRQAKNPVALCDELAAVTGKDKSSCWRFLNKHGIQRPGAATRNRFDRKKAEDLVEYISDHGVHAATLRFGYDAKSLYNLLYRMEHTHLSTDALSLRQLCAYLRIKYSQASRWVELGLLKAVRRESRTGAVSYLIEFDALQKFCKEHRNLLVTRRSSPNRIRFLEEFVFAPKHAELLRTRESKREAEAFKRGEYLEDTRGSQRSA